MPDFLPEFLLEELNVWAEGMYLRPMRFFYAPSVKSSVHLLGESEAKHLSRVLRARAGEQVLLTDGRGGRFEGEIALLDKKHCTINILQAGHEPAPAPDLTLVVAPTKSTDRFEWMLEKATEIGVSRIQPVWTERSERRQDKMDRWQRILVSALKQSQRFWLPELTEPLGFSEFLSSDLATSRPGKFIAHCEPGANEGQKPHLLHAMKRGENAWVAIGPEGDFSPEEIAAARAAGAQEVSLGEARLRTETAGVTAVHLMQLAQIL